MNTPTSYERTPSSSPSVCDHTSVGILVWRGNELLLIERRKFPYGFAPPAGHVDGDPTFEFAAWRELEEEVGLMATSFRLVAEGDRPNRCRRVNGTWHHWKVYRAQVEGGQPVRASIAETKQTGWYTREKLADLARRTEQYRAGLISEERWQAAPGLEPVWYDWLTHLGVLAGKEGTRVE
ncbi:MAG: NUDIX domain-containing protein [Ktedonobacteraceae bacterium]